MTRAWALLAMLAAPAAAATETWPSVEAGVGFPYRPRGEVDTGNHIARERGWVPFVASVRAEAGFTGHLEVRDALEPAVTYRRRVDLEAGQSAVYRFPVRTAARAEWDAWIVAGRQRQRLSLARSLIIGGDMPLVLHVAPATESTHLSDGDRPTTRIAADELPVEPLTLRGVDLVILDEVAHEELDDARATALAAWVAGGGRLAITGATAPRHGPLSGLLAADVVGRDERRTLATLDAVPGAPPVTLTEPVTVARLAPRPGATSWNEIENIAVHRRHGRGVVIQLGFSLRADFLREWSGAKALVRLLLEASSRRPELALATRETALTNTLRTLLERSLVKPIPRFSSVAGVSLTYLAAILAAPFILRRPGRRAWTWAAILLCGAGATATVYAIGSSYVRDRPGALRVSFVEGGAVAGAHLRHSFWALYTTARGRLDLAFPAGTIARPAADGAPRELHFGDGAQLRGLETYYQDTSLFETTDTVELAAALAYRARCTASGYEVHLEPSAGFPLLEAWLLHAGKAIPIAPGTTTVTAETQGDLATNAVSPPDALADVRAAVRAVVAAVAGSPLAADAPLPLLLYRYQAPGSLTALSELGLHFGLIDPAASEIRLPAAATQVTGCEPAQTPPPPRLPFAQVTESFEYTDSPLNHGWSTAANDRWLWTTGRASRDALGRALQLKARGRGWRWLRRGLPGPLADWTIDVRARASQNGDYQIAVGRGARQVATLEGEGGGHITLTVGTQKHGLSPGAGRWHRLTLAHRGGQLELEIDGRRFDRRPTPGPIDWVALGGRAIGRPSQPIFFDDLRVGVDVDGDGGEPALSSSWTLDEGRGWLTRERRRGTDGRWRLGAVARLDDEEWVGVDDGRPGALAPAGRSALSLPATAALLPPASDGTLQIRLRLDALPARGTQPVLTTGAAALSLDTRGIVGRVGATEVVIPHNAMWLARWYDVDLTWRSGAEVSIRLDGDLRDAALMAEPFAGTRCDWHLGSSADGSPDPLAATAPPTDCPAPTGLPSPGFAVAELAITATEVFP